MASNFGIVFVTKGEYRIAQTLIENGADAKAADAKGFTALYLSLQGKNDLDLVKLLIEHGANVNVDTFENGYSPLDNAILNERGNCISIANTRTII